MKMIQGHTFNVVKPRMEFKLGETYRIYHIAKLNKKIEDKDITTFKYIFYSKGGNIEASFDSTEHAEAIISKMSGK